jgi:zinc protease
VRAGRNKALRAAAFVLVFLLAGPAGRTAPVQGTEAGAVTPEKTVLGSGIPLILHRDMSSPVTVVALVVPGGLAAVPRGLDGLAAMTARLALEIPDEGKVHDLMAQATRMSFVCLEDFSVVMVECLSENLEEALRVAGKIVADPLLSGLRISRAKELMKLYARAEADDAVSAAHAAGLAGYFDGAGYGSAPFGTDESLKAIDRKDVVSFYRRHFTRSSVFITAVSDLEPGAVKALLERHFSDLPKGERPSIPAGPLIFPENRDIRLFRETKQTFLGRAFALPPPSPVDHARGVLLEVVIGQGPGSRLWGLRADERLAYTVDSRLTWTRSAGILEVFLETENAKSARASEALDRELEKLRADGLTAAELEATKAMARGRFLRSIEAKADRARLLAEFEVLGLGFGHLSELGPAIEAVTLEDLNAYVRAVLSPERAVKLTVGPEGPQERR